ncbi:MAG: serpin family protein [Clostridia bacterium]|nr:serpin family protein [Clostridia bacterium]
MKKCLFIKIVSVLTIIATMLTVAACTKSPAEQKGAVDLMREINVDRIRAETPTKDTTETLTSAFLSLFRATIPEENKSTLVSPLSIILALGMTADGTAGNTKAQFEDFFGMTTEQLDEAMAYLTFRLSDTGSKKVRFSSANSLWLAQSGVKFKTSYLERVKAAYDPSVYSVDFSDPATVDAINGWVNDNTDKMIEKIIEYGDVDAATVAALVNALVFDAEWAQKFEKVTNGTFTSYTGKEQSVEMMYSSEVKYIEGDDFTGFSKDYDGGKFSFVALLPDEKTDIFSFARRLDGKTVYELISSDTGEAAHIGMPKFTFDFDADLIPALMSLGLTDVFGGGADFTELAECQVGEIYVDKAIHKTHIEVDESGTKAAAATIVTIRKNAVMYEHEVVLDRPFFYMIVDNESSLPIFMGVMTEIK